MGVRGARGAKAVTALCRRGRARQVTGDCPQRPEARRRARVLVRRGRSAGESRRALFYALSDTPAVAAAAPFACGLAIGDEEAQSSASWGER